MPQDDEPNNSVFEQLEDAGDGLNFKPKGWRTISSDGAECLPGEKLIASGQTMAQAQALRAGNDFLMLHILEHALKRATDHLLKLTSDTAELLVNFKKENTE